MVYVSRRGHPKDWFLPMGRIRVGESVEMAAIRETYEETGLAIEVLGIPLLYKVDIGFKDWTLRRWHFIVTGKPHSSSLQPIDEEEIEEASFFQNRPYNSDPFLKRWLVDILNHI